MKISSGLLIIQNKKILLVHPTSAPWKNTYSIPKGGLENDETNQMAAIRETFEEVGLQFNESDLSKTEFFIDYKNKHGKIFKKVFYFVINLEPGTLPDVLSDDMLQKEEVDWAGFLDIETAKEKIFWRFEQMLDFIID